MNAVMVCPKWCTRTDHHADEVDLEHPPVHYGPMFNSVYIQGPAEQPEAIVVLVSSGISVTDLDELREVAADMVKAAEWIEARA